MSEINIIERRIVPDKPKVIAKEQIEIYVPLASHVNQGIASFDPVSFNVENGHVALKTIINNINDGTGNFSVNQVADGVIDGFDFTGKNSNAANLDDDVLFWNEGIVPVPYGATGNFASAFGGKSAAIGKRSMAIGTTTIAKGNYSFASGDNSVAIGDDSHAEGYKNTAYGKESHAEGFNNVAYGRTSHAEGNGTEAFGEGSHAEGTQTHATGDFSHAEGNSTVALALYSHTEGEHTKANARGSHAGGYFTVATNPYQTVVGKYNAYQNMNNVLFQVGNGVDEAHRSNALTVFSDGSININGPLYINSTPYDGNSAVRLSDLNEVRDQIHVLENTLKYYQVAAALEDYEEVVSVVKNTGYRDMWIGQSLYVINTNVPDLWISRSYTDFVDYVYVSDEQFLQDLSNSDGVLRIGYYGISELETKNSGINADLTNYLQKTTNTYSRRRAYAVNTNGTQLMLDVGYSNDAVNQTLAVRDVYGSLYVPDSSIGKTYNFASGEEAVNRNYVDNNCVAKKTVTAEQILTIKPNGTTDSLSFNIVPAQWNIVRRDGNSQIEVVETPTADNHAASKKYVDTAVASVSGSDLSDYIKKSAFNSSYGMKISNGYVMLNAASESDITTGTNTYKGITPARVDFLVKKGLVNNKLSLSTAEKANIYSWLGISNTELYLHTLTYTETQVGPSDKSSKIFIVNNSPDDITAVTYELLQKALSVKIEVKDSYGDSYTNTVRGYSETHLHLHGTNENVTVGSMNYTTLKNLVDTKTPI